MPIMAIMLTDMLRSPRLRRRVARTPSAAASASIAWMNRCRQHLDGLAVLLRAPDNFIVDVRYIAHIRDVETARPQPALHHIENHQHSSVAQMAIVIDRHAANVHFDLAGLYGNKLLFFPGERIVDSEHAGEIVN